MAIEKTFLPVGPVSFTLPGGANGAITVTSTLGFKVKMAVGLSSPSLPLLRLEVKRVLSPTVMELGPPGVLSLRSDLSSYPATTSQVIAHEQPRNFNIPLQEIVRAVYDEEPSVAWRVLPVDPFGRFYTAANPLPVQLSDGSINIETLNAELRVQLSSKDNDPTAGDVHSSVRIGDENNELLVNADRSINVKVIGTSTPSERVVSVYNEVAALGSASLTTLASYTVPAGKTAALQLVDVNGENIANYSVLINGTVIDRKRTAFGSALNAVFGFPGDGVPLVALDLVQVKTIHGRPAAGDFGARIQVLEIG